MTYEDYEYYLLVWNEFAWYYTSCNKKFNLAVPTYLLVCQLCVTELRIYWETVFSRTFIALENKN